MQFSRWQHYSPWQLSLARSSPLLQSKKTGVLLELVGGSVTQKCKWVVWCTVTDEQERSESKVPFSCCSAAFWQCSQGTLPILVPVSEAPPPPSRQGTDLFQTVCARWQFQSGPFEVPPIHLPHHPSSSLSLTRLFILNNNHILYWHLMQQYLFIFLIKFCL